MVENPLILLTRERRWVSKYPMWRLSCSSRDERKKMGKFPMPNVSATPREWTPDIEQQILHAIRDVRYGSVEIIIHNSKVVQIERKEKIRFDREQAPNRK